jgi:pimeloyl-ACP methyl ester carboxylesterase
MPMATVNGAELYHEVRGDGPPVLLVMGATGDGGHFDALADLLADEFTVISYDRRGNGRSPRPAGWVTTSPKEQADDAAALLAALGVGPAAAFGTSSGANFTLALIIHHPSAVRGAILHEPVMTSLTDDPAAVRGAAATLLKEGIEAGGRPSGRSFAKSARSACRSCSAQKAGRGGACFASASGSQCRRRSRARSGR